MGDYIIDAGATIMCPHAGSVKITSTNTRVKVGGQYATILNDMFMISGCPFQLPGTPPVPHPCIKIQWLVPAMRVKVMGKQVLLKSSTGLCLASDQVPQGSPNVVITQLRVKGT